MCEVRHCNLSPVRLITRLVPVEQPDLVLSNKPLAASNDSLTDDLLGTASSEIGRVEEATPSQVYSAGGRIVLSRRS